MIGGVVVVVGGGLVVVDVWPAPFNATIWWKDDKLSPLGQKMLGSGGGGAADVEVGPSDADADADANCDAGTSAGGWKMLPMLPTLPTEQNETDRKAGRLPAAPGVSVTRIGQLTTGAAAAALTANALLFGSCRSRPVHPSDVMW